MNQELQSEFEKLEETIQAGNFSVEGLEYLIENCKSAADEELGGIAIAIYLFTRNCCSFRDSCTKLYLWACEKYGAEIVDGSLEKYLDKVHLSNTFNQEF